MEKSVAGVILVAAMATVPAMADMQKGSIELGWFEDESAAYQQVKIPMEEVLKIAVGKTAGRVVSAKLEKDDGYLIYEVKVVEPSGAETEYDIDPVTGEILDTDKE